MVGSEHDASVNIAFKEKFIAFVDVLGFKSLVARAEANDSVLFNQVVGILNEYGSADHRANFDKSGPMICPGSRYVQRNLDFRATKISDCAVLSAETSPAGVINLIGHCSALALSLLLQGVMCRGYITRGRISHSDTDFHGSGYQRALEKESQVAVFKRHADERGTPFIEVDSAVTEYIATSGDSCVQKLLDRFVKSDGELIALFPFKRLEHSFVIGGWNGNKFDAEKERENNNNVRKMVADMRTKVAALVDSSNQSAVQKSEHYIRSLDAQIAVCDSTDNMLLTMQRPISSRW